MHRRTEVAKIAVLASGAIAMGLGFLAQRRLVDEQDETAGLALWGIAICVFLFGMLIARTARSEASDSTVVVKETVPGETETALAPRVEFLLFITVLAIGSFFRLYKIDSIPPGLNHDSHGTAYTR